MAAAAGSSSIHEVHKKDPSITKVKVSASCRIW